MATKRVRRPPPAPTPGPRLRRDKVGNPTPPARESVLKKLPERDRVLADLDERYPYASPPRRRPRKRRR